MDRQTLMVRRTIAGGGVVLVLILLVLGVRGCLDARKERAFKDYARDVKELADASNQQSTALFGLLRDPGDQGAVELQQTVNGFAVEADQLVDRADDLDAPDELKGANRYLIDTLELRRDGMRGVAGHLRTALGDEGRSEATQRIAAEMLNFLASDVIYLRRVIPRLQDPLNEEGVLDEVEVGRSQFLPDVDWLRPGTVADRINRIRGGGGGEDGDVAPGLHGNGIAGVSVQPSGQALAAGGAVEIRLSESLRFDVSVQNQGENEETDVTVKVTISGAGRPIVIEDRLDTIAAGETKLVQIPVTEPPPTGRPVQITVEVEPVPGEEKTDNNKLEARGIFTR